MRCGIAGDELRRWGLPHRPKNPAEPLPNLSPTPLNSPLPRRTRQRPQRGRVGEGVASEIPSAMQLDELPPLTPQPPAPPQSMRPSPWGTRGGVTGGTHSISDRTPFTANLQFKCNSYKKDIHKRYCKKHQNIAGDRKWMPTVILRPLSGVA